MQNNKKRKRWSKIWLLNIITITTFFLSLSIILAEEIMNFINHSSSSWKITDFNTWRPIHIICIITFVFLLVEQIALLKSNHIDMLKIVSDVKQIKKE